MSRPEAPARVLSHGHPWSSSTPVPIGAQSCEGSVGKEPREGQVLSQWTPWVPEAS